MPPDHVAVDLGATGGVVTRGAVTPDGLGLETVHRFRNRPVEADGRYVWDTDRLLVEIATGLQEADGAGPIDSVAIDTWGVDFGLVGEDGPAGRPSSYRDPEATATKEAVVSTVGRRELFEATGITNWNTPNTLFQYHRLATAEPERLERADRLLMMPQFLTYRLGGRPAGETTVASTTQLFDVRSREWARDLLTRLDLPVEPLPEPEPPGTAVGGLDPDIAVLDSDPELLLPASHDTASAVAGLPLGGGHRAFLSSGTWFLVGVEREEPVITDAAFEAGASNELGIDDTVRFLTNLTGFFLLEECREAWADPDPPAYDDLLGAAGEAPAFGPLLDPDDPLFDIEADMPAAVREYCRRTGQPVPDTRGALVRCLLESLAARTANALEELLTAAGVSSDRLHVGGGGVRNDLFLEMLAGAVGRPVVAGPAEATAVGNLLAQSVARGSIGGVREGRAVIRDETSLRRTEPRETDRWAAARARLADLPTVG